MARGGGARVYQLPRLVHPVEKPVIRFRVMDRAMPLLDAMAEAGGSMEDSKDHRDQMMSEVAKFQEGAGSLLDEAITAHAERYKSGFYKKDEAGRREETRQIGLLSFALYLSGCVNDMLPKVLQKNDAGTSSLYEIAFRKVAAFLDEAYYSRTPGEVYSWYVDNEPVLSASLRRCGMEERVVGFQKSMEMNVKPLVERTLAAHALL